MLKNKENIKIEYVFSGTSKKSNSVRAREYSALVLRTAGSMRYFFPEYTLDTHPGDIYILPKDAQYDYVSLTDTPCRYLSIWFTGDIDLAVQSIHSIDGFPDANELVESLADLWNFGDTADRYRCYSIIYNLLSYIKTAEKITYADKKKTTIIAPAMAYLKNHIYDSQLNIETLVGLCGVSGTYFYKIFEQNYSMPPQKYILSKRLSQAKSIIDSGDYDCISEVAAQVGFQDPLYFSRAFRKKYGVSPSQYAKQHIIKG